MLVGFSMGSGEVTRYLGTYGSARVRKAALLGGIQPFVLKTDDNPEGIDGAVFEGIKAAVLSDRYAFAKDFLASCYNFDELGGTRISDQALQASFNVAVGASAYATYACVDTWLTDFRPDLPKIDVPTLVLHGTADRVIPTGVTADRLPALVKDVRLVKVEGGSHTITWTHAEEVNQALLEFFAE
jgi:non-heme chloroperoxidase